ncbi:Ig-like domain-containing protein [Thermococcus sp.]|uniref:Ig-like domain-containing protein n=1 Tax=Thermococcus sp. TaxID=35749 RepID=UPI002628A34B|nr:Ig-like domain-containing protein [Thermococcus sp.]
MKKKYQNWLIAGFLAALFVVGYLVVAKPDSAGPGVLLNLDNQSNSTETYQLAVSDLTAAVDQATGHVLVSFKLTNEEHFNVSSVQVLYALNVADPNNATYAPINATEANGTYKAEIPSRFGDVIYYKVKVVYDGNKSLESDVQSITVKDTTAPTATLSIEYNATTGNATITITASDNDAIDRVILFYAVTADGNLSSVTFSNVTLTVSPYTYTLTVDSNTTDSTYYYLDVYAEVYDLSGNMARVPANGTVQLYANETKTIGG